MIMLKASRTGQLRTVGWIDGFVSDFKNRVVNLLQSSLHHLPINLCLSLITPALRKEDPTMDPAPVDSNSRSGLPLITYKNVSISPVNFINDEQVGDFFSPHDLIRFERFSQQLIDRHTIADLLPTLAWLLLTNRLGGLSLSTLQSAVLLGMGCQRKSGTVVWRSVWRSSVDKFVHVIVCSGCNCQRV